MNATLMEWLARALASDTPAQPALWVAQLWLPLGWGLVLAWLGAALVGWRSARRGGQWAVAAALLVWSCWPGAWSPAYWLGLAFQAPSLLLVLLCACGLYKRLMGRRSGRPQARSVSSSVVLLALAGAVLGWALLLDSFAVLPLELYAWGFSPVATAALAVLALLPWALDRDGRLPRLAAWLPGLAVLLFMALRLPTGNVWDALLDPWLWLALQVWLLRSLWNRY